MKKSNTVFVLLLFVGVSCQSLSEKEVDFTDKPLKEISLNEAELYDKILGQMVGSAIGDAMGAPTEMWSRVAIKLEYGDVKGLDSMVREPSPEGTWKYNLPAGGTTDDTRWKALTYSYLTKTKSQELVAKDFMQVLVDQYLQDLGNFKKIDSFDPEPFEENTRKVAWLQEWAKVAKPYTEGDFLAYHDALSRFYGGEMVCAGLLYAPAIGVFYPENPERAYQEMYKISLFDIGYARDISGLAAAMTAVGMKKGASPQDLLAVLRNIDPNGFFKSRLVGRTSYRILQLALNINQEAKKLPLEEQRQKAFEMLDGHLQDMPFHAGEIHLQVITAMLFSDFDFTNTMTFLVNYGRDNDTTAAVAGGILGAYYGFEKLPIDMREKVMKVGKEELEIDMEKLSMDMAKKVISFY
ncbi:ADP-ribosylglycohydrolase [Spirosomataceae bacterium TFI 002]|nr:ADP-ribosylglycohydrolase [Spirosomataceae bacterium TFI 002]